MGEAKKQDLHLALERGGIESLAIL